ncbi:MAG: hypothetical protein K0Q47_32 [Sedimentibacter sp.]|jgi:hypothetical protein|nr:hypothetical protein [Sedimentibacter sp.]
MSTLKAPARKMVITGIGFFMEKKTWEQWYSELQNKPCIKCGTTKKFVDYISEDGRNNYVIKCCHCNHNIKSIPD